MGQVLPYRAQLGTDSQLTDSLGHLSTGVRRLIEGQIPEHPGKLRLHCLRDDYTLGYTIGYLSVFFAQSIRNPSAEQFHALGIQLFEGLLPLEGEDLMQRALRQLAIGNPRMLAGLTRGARDAVASISIGRFASGLREEFSL